MLRKVNETMSDSCEQYVKKFLGETTREEPPISCLTPVNLTRSACDTVKDLLCTSLTPSHFQVCLLEEEEENSFS
jgi:hypothetical protein